MSYQRIIASIIGVALLCSCQSISNISSNNGELSTLQKSPPRSILVLPPRNHSTAVDAPYTFLSTISRPLANRGYYVFPVAVIDRYMKENGVTHPEAMHDVPRANILEHIGADAVLYVDIESWGRTFDFIESIEMVRSTARLIDTLTGELLWDTEIVAENDNSDSESSSFTEMVLNAVVDQIAGSFFDDTVSLSSFANEKAIHDTYDGLPPGPYHPDVLSALDD